MEGCDGERDDLRSLLSRLSRRDRWQYFAKDGHCNDSNPKRYLGWRIYREDESKNEFKRCQCGAWRPIYGHNKQPNFSLATDIHFEKQSEANRFISRYKRGLPQSDTGWQFATLAILGLLTAIETYVSSYCNTNGP